MARVLVVDDSPFARSALKALLEASGHEVAGEASTGPEVLPLYRAERPDLVLLDVLLPGRSGLEVLREIRAEDSGARVVMVTAVRQEKIHDEARRDGALGVIQKPFDAEDLRSALSRALEDGA